MKNPKEKISATAPDAPVPTNLTKETLTRVFLTREDLDTLSKLCELPPDDQRRIRREIDDLHAASGKIPFE